MAAVNGEKAGELATADFCERHASSSAQNFVRDFLAFDRNTPGIGRSKDPFDYAKKFTEFFLRHFEYELKRSSFAARDSFAEVNSHHINAIPEVNRSAPGGREPRNGETEDYDDQDSSPERGASPARKPHNKGILRRFSFKNIRKARLFKQTSDEVDAAGGDGHHSHHQNHRSKHFKHKDRKSERHRTTSFDDNSVVKKDGIVNVLQPGDDSRGKSRWEKARLVLVKAPGGHLLEFYMPPKVYIFIHIYIRYTFFFFL